MVELSKTIKITLTERERIERGQRLSEILSAIDNEREALKSESQRRKARVQEFIEEERKLRHAVAVGEEFRDVAVKERINEKLHQVDLVRADTGEVLDSRPMTPAERQGKLPKVDVAPANGSNGNGKVTPIGDAKKKRARKAPKDGDAD